MRQMSQKGWEKSIRLVTIIIVLVLVFGGMLMNTYGINSSNIIDISDCIESYVVKSDGTAQMGEGKSFPSGILHANRVPAQSLRETRNHSETLY